MFGRGQESISEEPLGRWDPFEEELWGAAADGSDEEEEEATLTDVPEEGDIFRRDHMPRAMHWSVSWSDLMMTMFILFLIMYIWWPLVVEYWAQYNPNYPFWVPQLSITSPPNRPITMMGRSFLKSAPAMIISDMNAKMPSSSSWIACCNEKMDSVVIC